jgi:hypothetical protein
MKLLCGVFTKNRVFLKKCTLVEDRSLAIPFTLSAMESEEVIPFELIEHIGLIGDMSKGVPEMNPSDFDGSMRRAQATIDTKTWLKVKRELKQRGIHLHGRH